MKDGNKTKDQIIEQLRQRIPELETLENHSKRLGETLLENGSQEDYLGGQKEKRNEGNF